MSRDVYFETLTASHRGLVMRSLRRGDRVFVYDFTYRLKSIDWLAPLIDAGRVERIYVHGFSRADHLAIDAATWLSSRWADHPLVGRLAAVFGADEVMTVLRKALVDWIFRYLFVRLDLEQRRDPTRETIVVPDTYRTWERALRRWPEAPAPLATVRIPRGAALWSRWAGRLERFRQAERLLGAAVLRGLRTRRAGRRTPDRRAFDHVYAIDQSFQAKFTEGRRFDFFVDGELLTRKNTGFVISEHADGPWVDEARSEGFEMVRRRDYEGLARLDDDDAPPRPPIARLILRAALSPSAPAWLRLAAAEGALVAITDVPFLERVGMRNYLYTNQDTVLQGWRNALLRRYGVRSWCFTLAIGGGYLYGDGPETEHRAWAFLNADAVVTASTQMIGYYRRHGQRVGSYHAVGNIWSELALVAGRREGRAALRRRWFGEDVAGPVVAWFDTSFVEDARSPSTYAEAIAWYRDLERSLDDFPEVRVVVKPSKDEAYFVDLRTQWADPRYGPELMEIWRRLRAHPRVHFAGHQGDPTSIIAGSDLVITFCFSSISAEALGAGRRAFWYEPGDRWRATLYGTVPGLVAHGYAELLALTRGLLYETDDAAYRAYLDGVVRGSVEDYLDASGLTRFRRLLAAAGSAA